MKWNLRLAAANRGIWKASELQRMLADHGLAISAGKMSGLWSGNPASIKLSDLDVICAVLGCGVGDLTQHAGGLKPPPAGRLRRATNPPSLMQHRTQLPHYLTTASFVRGTRNRTPGLPQNGA